VQAMAARSLEDRAKRIAEIESQPSSGVNVASMGDGNDAEWRRLSERASASQTGANLKVVPSGAPRPPVSSRPDVASSVRRTPRAGSRESDRPRSSLVVPTPVHPIDIGSLPRPPAPAPPATSSAPRLAESGSNPLLEAPNSAAALPPKGPPWKETWDGAGWNMALRSISRVHVGLFAMFALTLAGGMFSQRRLFGIELLIGTGVWIAFALFMIARMLRWTYIRLDPRELLIEYKPNGRSSTIATPGLARFIVIHAGPGDDADVFYVHFMPVNGETQRLDIDFSTAADARYAMHRLNEMLAQVRGGGQPRKPLESAHGGL